MGAVPSSLSLSHSQSPSLALGLCLTDAKKNCVTQKKTPHDQRVQRPLWSEIQQNMNDDLISSIENVA